MMRPRSDADADADADPVMYRLAIGLVGLFLIQLYAVIACARYTYIGNLVPLIFISTAQPRRRVDCLERRLLCQFFPLLHKQH